MPNKFTEKEFINRDNEVHDNVYRYDKAIYAGSNSRLTITCLRHGDFEQLAQFKPNDNGPFGMTYGELYQDTIVREKSLKMQGSISLLYGNLNLEMN